MKIRPSRIFCLAALALLIGSFQNPVVAQNEQKPLLTGIGELPERTYEIECAPGDLAQSPALMRRLAGSLLEEATADLKDYRFGNGALKRKFYSRRLHGDLALERWNDALHCVDMMRRLSPNEALEHIALLHAEAWIRARQAAGADKSLDSVRHHYARSLKNSLATLPKKLVRHELARRRAKIGAASESLINMMFSSIKGERTDRGTWSLTSADAHELLSFCNALTIIVPFKDITLELYGDFLEQSESEGQRKLDKRRFSLSPKDRGCPVAVAIWDTGVDTSVFPDRLFRNQAECADGADTDGNGFVDDLHGIAFGTDLEATTGLLMPLGFDSPTDRELRALLQGVEDRQAGLNSAAADKIQELAATLDQETRGELGKKIGLFDFYCHGTHVAGIAVSGNPFAQILTVRVGFDDSKQKTVEWARAFVTMCADSVAYFRSHGVRVANMSWGWDVHEIEDNLRAHNAGRSPGELATRAREIYAILDEGLHEVLAGAPDILFVNGAGDAPGDRSAYRWIPGIYDLPNLIVVGAVDADGKATAFSNHGSHVRLHADGFRVDSFVPGGERLRLSGTSMATPQVTNLAAKLFALDPSLTPDEVAALILGGAEQTGEGQNGILLLDPKRTLVLFQDR